MKSLFLFFALFFITNTCLAETNLMISTTNGFVLAYKTTSTYYMLSTARLFNRTNGTRINCFGLNDTINLIAVPNEGYQFDYWAGTIPLNGYTTTFILTGDIDLVAHFKKLDDVIICTECPVCPICETWPDPIICPDCICPDPIECPKCPDCICPDPIECPKCPDCIKKEDDGYCFIKTLTN